MEKDIHPVRPEHKKKTWYRKRGIEFDMQRFKDNQSTCQSRDNTVSTDRYTSYTCIQIQRQTCRKTEKKTNSHRGRQRQTERPLNSQIYTHKQAGVSRQTFSHRQTERQPLGYVDRRADIQAYVLRQIHRQPISQTYWQTCTYRGKRAKTDWIEYH